MQHHHSQCAGWVTTATPMKRGLKEYFLGIILDRGKSVTTATPMKRGLKVSAEWEKILFLVLQPLPR